ncbi:FkbM family methyltransferase [Methylobacterium sp. Leaf108]|uniref:FkbM family methyltransferase n=1 Tax=Methylobacterium sp. Leaf108 TaxID=1736256 RepID=UPI00138F0DC1|nr:FkbM family methyltransferase [Methylobacterium sp. Leaf108]
MKYASHVGQDQWVTEVYRGLRGGYFLEFGAFDGVTTSNTVYLEKELGWNGICVEANPRYYKSVCANRSCITVNCALWPESRICLDLEDAHGLSKLLAVDSINSTSLTRESISKGIVSVDTLHPIELLDRFGAPAEIHYMSLDIEGAELQVLEAFDFYRYSFGLVSVEHNFEEPKRAAIRHIFKHFGYKVCELRNDDLFYHPAVLHGLSEGRCENPEHVCNRVLNSYVF